MEATIRFSQNSPPGSQDQRFLRVDVTGKSFRLCQITKRSRNTIKYDVIQASAKVPAFRAFDWHPTNETLIAVGQSGGEATLLNIADGYQDSISFSVRSQRLCNAVNLSSQNLIAVGLDKVRTDFCLNVWDLSQRLPTGNTKGFSRTNTEPLHKLAGGEPITSLKFFDREPQLLLAGVKGQFVRLCDLREPNSSNGLQFSTRCVHNLAIDNLDDNYFASCYPSNEPLVCLWDRRMVSRTYNSPVNFGGSALPESRQPEISLELRNPIDNPGVVWSLRFSKTRRGCLGVLSNTGHLKVYDIAKDYVLEPFKLHKQQGRSTGHETEPQNIFLDDARDIEHSFSTLLPPKEQKKRVVSFDFTTTNTRYNEPRLIVMTGEGELRMVELRPPPEPAGLSSTGFICKGSVFQPCPTSDSGNENIAKSLDRIRRTAEPRNALRQVFKQSKQNKASAVGQHTDLRRMSSFSNHCWDSDLGFFERGVGLEDLLKLISAARLRCKTGYLLNATKNKVTAGDSQWLEWFWSWIEQAERVSRNGNMTQENMDLAYIGIYGIWMEEIAVKPRLVGTCSVPVSTVIKNLVNRLNIPVRRICPTEYRAHRLLCLHVSGLAWGNEELETMVKKLISGNQHMKAAAIALFASNEKLAYQALRSKTSAQTHKMLAMALAGSKQRRKAARSASGTEDSSNEGDDDDWTETISSLSSDLTDPYARAILAYVKSSDWVDVLEIDSLPLKHRIGVAIRHLDDNDLTAYIGRTTRQVIEAGDIEGIILTGTGSTEGLGLLSSYARIFNDLQTAILGLTYGGAAERFIVTNDRDVKARRTIEALRDTYRSQIMHWGLKFDRVRFDVASSKALALSPQHKLPRPKEQVRLVCTFCSGSLTQFQSNGVASNVSTPGAGPISNNRHVTDKHPLTAEKAAVIGTVCPKCGRHLPRCGVCDLWLGTPDESYAKWFALQQQQNNKVAATTNGADARSKLGSIDMTASMTGSTVTAVGPVSSSNAKLRAGMHGDEGEANNDDNIELARKVEERWHDVMQKFIVYCVTCGHGFHASHARLWFEGRDGQDGHRICPVPECQCRCNG